MSVRDERPLDAEEALSASLERLRREFCVAVTDDTISAYLQAAFEHVRQASRLESFVPLLAERFARQRLEALTWVEGRIGTGVPLVLFVCRDDAGPSQMALGLFEHHAGGRAVGWSGGTRPATAVSPAVVEAMAERGIDLSEEFPKPCTQEVLHAADVVVRLGDARLCEELPGRRYVDWRLPVVRDESLAGARALRDELEARVLSLLAELAAASSGRAHRPTGAAARPALRQAEPSSAGAPTPEASAQ